MLWAEWYTTALEYFQKKFNVCILLDKKGKIISVY